MREIFTDAGLSVTWYDRKYPTQMPGTAVAGDAPFYLAQARRAGGPILELGCGTGRISLFLARRGLSVTGLDLSPGMLKLARIKAAMERPAGEISFVRANMASFRLRRKFGLILIPFRAFQHLLTPKAQLNCLACARRHLRPRGRLIIDIFDPRLDMCHPGSGQRASDAFRGRERYRDPGTGQILTVKCLKRRTDPERQLLREIWLFSVRGRNGRILARHRNRVTLRWTYRYEMSHLLNLCGLEVTALYGDFRRGPPRYGAEQIWLVRRAQR